MLFSRSVLVSNCLTDMTPFLVFLFLLSNRVSVIFMVQGFGIFSDFSTSTDKLKSGRARFPCKSYHDVYTIYLQLLRMLEQELITRATCGSTESKFRLRLWFFFSMSRYCNFPIGFAKLRRTKSSCARLLSGRLCWSCSNFEVFFVTGIYLIVDR